MPYTDEMIANARADAFGQAAPDSPLAEGVTKRYGEATTVRPFDGQPDQLTEMDAIVAYLQILGRLTEAALQDRSQVGQVTMDVAHDTLVWFAKSVGLFYLIGLSLMVLAYTFWPSNKKRFEKAAASILDEEDRPCR